MNTIKRLRLEIVPAYFVEGGNELRIRVLVNDREFGVSRALVHDDMTSFFDHIFDVAKDQIREAIRTEHATAVASRE